MVGLRWVWYHTQPHPYGTTLTALHIPNYLSPVRYPRSTYHYVQCFCFYVWMSVYVLYSYTHPQIHLPGVTSPVHKSLVCHILADFLSFPVSCQCLVSLPTSPNEPPWRRGGKVCHRCRVAWLSRGGVGCRVGWVHLQSIIRILPVEPIRVADRSVPWHLRSFMRSSHRLCLLYTSPSPRDS